jgi:predicted ATP-grasp superfamily ATP-dependent carboligase
VPRVFVYEFMSAEAARDERAASLHVEGRAMLEAACADFRGLPGVEVVTVAEDDGPSVESVFRACARRSDFTMVIAPEFAGLLEERCRWVMEEGGRLLGPTPAGVRRTADKLALARHWQQHGVPTPATHAWSPGTPAPVAFPLVCKPRFGAGSQAMRLVREPGELTGITENSLLMQPWLPGRAASVAVILGDQNTMPLQPAWQHLSDDGRFQYLGGELPLPGALAARATRLAMSAVSDIAGLRGYVGVDLLLGAAADGRDDVAIEINPRLTTSYVGLRVLAASNLAALMLAAASGDVVPSPTWRTGNVRFLANGDVWTHPTITPVSRKLFK